MQTELSNYFFLLQIQSQREEISNVGISDWKSRHSSCDC